MIEEPKPEYRTGIGTDIHRVVEGRKLMLCGVYVPYPAGLAGHSDGDVGLHAVIDALLGAAGMGDIGTWFPDTDEKWKDADSKALLFLIREQLVEKNWQHRSHLTETASRSLLRRNDSSLRSSTRTRGQCEAS